jgi:hypothetical protein
LALATECKNRFALLGAAVWGEVVAAIANQFRYFACFPTAQP